LAGKVPAGGPLCTRLFPVVVSSQLCESGSEASTGELVWSGGIFLFTRGFINVFGRRAAGFHRQAKLSELNFFIRKYFL